MAAVPPSVGALQWEEALTTGMVQTAVPTFNHTPEGRIYGRPGLTCIVVTDTVYMFVKTTDASLATGWVGVDITP